MRIIAGKLRGLKLNEFDADNIRPTIDRVREAVFNKIQFRIKDALVLDLFCGTGAVSLEFVSRGAEVTSVDNNPSSIKLIKENFKKAKIAPNLIESDFKTALKKLVASQFDIVFLDPPFATNYGEEAIKFLAEHNMLKSDGVIVYEHAAGKTFEIPQNFSVVDQKKYGTIVVSYLEQKR